MDVPDRVTELVPHLRRYARALGTSEISSDELVRATLERGYAVLAFSASPAGVLYSFTVTGDGRVLVAGRVTVAFAR